MRELKKEEMLKVEGGAVSYTIITAIASGIITFIVGILHGYANPKKCN